MKPQRNKDILPKKLKPECGASLQRCNANKGNRETIVFCLLLVSNLSLQIPRVTLSCHNTMDCNRTPTLRGTENTPDLDWEITVGLSRIGLSAVSAGFTFIKRLGVRLLESNWNAATRETTVTIAMLLPRPSAFEAVLPTLQVVTRPGKFSEQRAFFYSEERLSVVKSSARTTEDLH